MEDINNIELVKSIIKTKQELKNANINYEIAEEELIDFYSYQIKAQQAKLDYLIKKVKERNIAINMVEQIEISNRDVG